MKKLFVPISVAIITLLSSCGSKSPIPLGADALTTMNCVYATIYNSDHTLKNIQRISVRNDSVVIETFKPDSIGCFPEFLDDITGYATINRLVGMGTVKEINGYTIDEYNSRESQ